MRRKTYRIKWKLQFPVAIATWRSQAKLLSSSFQCMSRDREPETRCTNALLIFTMYRCTTYFVEYVVAYREALYWLSWRTWCLHGSARLIFGSAPWYSQLHTNELTNNLYIYIYIYKNTLVYIWGLRARCESCLVWCCTCSAVLGSTLTATIGYKDKTTHGYG